MLLIRYDCDYADEFSVRGFVVLSEEEWSEHKRKVAILFDQKEKAPLPDSFGAANSWRNQQAKTVEVYFGTNESMIYESYDSYMSFFSVETLTKNQFEVLKDLFGELQESYEEEDESGKVTVVPESVRIYNGTVIMIEDFESENI